MNGTPLPTAVCGVVASVLAVAWIIGHVVSHRLLLRWGSSGGRRFMAFLIRAAVGTFGLWAFWEFLSRFIVLETTWRPLVSGLIGALAIELVIALYAWERRILEPHVGRTLLALRVAAVAIVLIILAQPVLAWRQSRKIERRVAILLDDSESMQLADRQMSASEKLELARFYNVAAAARRPPLHAWLEAAREQQTKLTQEAAKWRGTTGAPTDGNPTWPAAQRESLNRIIDEGLQFADSTRIAAGEALQLDETSSRVLAQVRGMLHERFAGQLREARNQLAQNRGPVVHDHLTQAADLLRQSIDFLPGLVHAVDESFLGSLTDSERRSIEEMASIPRSRLAQEVLSRSGPGGSLFDRLRARYDVTCFRFGKTATAGSEDISTPVASPGPEFRMGTDVTAALEYAMQTIPAESLAGVLLLSDGQHNGEKPIDDAARALGLQGSPVRAVGIGSSKGPRDAAFLKVEAPESIYLGDRLKVKAEIKADGMKGSQLTVTLREGQKVVDTQKVPIPEASHRATLRLAYTPEARGVPDYTVKIDAVEGELFENNNEWKFETAVTDDRTNVLLVESYPRWEFRYLRNLFYARDQSVHLQYVLLKPDQIRNQDPRPMVRASADRDFGEAEATALPASLNDWLKFDVIIIGDIQPGQFPGEYWEIIENCVSERGALLVVIAGPLAMPRAYANETVKRLLPVDYAVDSTTGPAAIEPAYALRLTAAGRESRIMQQSASTIENAEIWGSLPKLMWRHPVRGVKPGAEVLAYAEVDGRRLREARTAEDTLAAFAQQRQFEAQNALLVTSRHGLGKVALLAFDETWRLRYGTGDVYHHRFWGNLLRWGTGESLRSGTEKVRLGTDKLTYETTESVKVLARLTADGFKPHTKADVTAVILDPAGQVAARRQFVHREGSSGMYEADIPADALRQTGRFRVQLQGNDVDRLLQGAGVSQVETHFTRLATTTPVELGDLARDNEFLQKIAALSGGSVSTLNDAPALDNAFGAESKVVDERRETSLWDNWILLVTAVGLLTSEWLIRRRHALA